MHTATLVGEQLRYAASYQGHWLALLGWSAAAWHLAPREAWLHWSEDQRRRRLHWLAQNSRLVIRAERTQFPNLGTRALKLCSERLSADWQAQHGHPILGVGSFVDGQLFRGTIYKASNWTRLGPTAGFGPVIYACTRAQAVADGFQVEVTKTAAEAGIKFPVFLTRSVFDKFVAVPTGVTAQDEAGRLWDILTMLRFAILRARPGTGRLPVALYVRNDNRRPRLIKLVATCGPLDIDDPQPAITVMTPEED